eukprot:4207585-Amphidinium_carterae.1
MLNLACFTSRSIAHELDHSKCKGIYHPQDIQLLRRQACLLNSTQLKCSCSTLCRKATNLQGPCGRQPSVLKGGILTWRHQGMFKKAQTSAIPPAEHISTQKGKTAPHESTTPYKASLPGAKNSCGIQSLRFARSSFSF